MATRPNSSRCCSPPSWRFRPCSRSSPSPPRSRSPAGCAADAGCSAGSRRLPWERPMVLATGLGFVMLGFGGFGGIVNMGYGMNAMVHNTSWVTAHFHLIFGGSVVIMYFAIAYEIWPRLTGRDYRLAGAVAAPALAVVHRHDGDDAALALARAAGPVAARRELQLRRSDHRRLGAVGGGLIRRRDHPADLRAAVRAQSRRAPSGHGAGRSAGRSTRSRFIRRSACRPRSTASACGTCWCWC